MSHCSEHKVGYFLKIHRIGLSWLAAEIKEPQKKNSERTWTTRSGLIELILTRTENKISCLSTCFSKNKWKLKYIIILSIRVTEKYNDGNYNNEKTFTPTNYFKSYWRNCQKNRRFDLPSLTLNLLGACELSCGGESSFSMSDVLFKGEQIRGLIPTNSGSGKNLYGSLLSSIFLKVMEILQNQNSKRNDSGYINIYFSFACGTRQMKWYLFAGTPGIQCLAISAPFPFRMNTDLKIGQITIF